MRKSEIATLSRRQLLIRGLAAGSFATITPVLGSFGAALAQTTARRTPTLVGVNVGYGMSTAKSLADIMAFEKVIGRPVDYISEFGAHATWKEAVTSAAHALRIWRSVAVGSRRRMLWHQPLTMTGTPLSAVAAGTHDDSFLAIAVNIRNAGFYDATINLGRDMTGEWTPWSAAGENKAAYIAAFRRVAAIFRKVSPSFKICWSPMRNLQAIAPEEVYPGDDHVDLVGMSVLIISPPLGPHLQSFVEATVIGHGAKAVEGKQPYGLAWLAEFAKAHHKPMIIPELAIGVEVPVEQATPIAFDDDVIIATLAKWIEDHDVILHVWRDVPRNESYGLHTRISRASVVTSTAPEDAADERPRMAMAYRKAWGSRTDG